MIKNAIFCEGKTDISFLEKLIDHLKLDKNYIRFYIMGNKNNFFAANHIKYLNLKLEIENNTLEKLLFIVDADDIKNDVVYGGFENTQNALSNTIADLGFQDISQTYIMCDPNTKSGYLESFILSTIPEQQRSCIERFLECSQFKSKENHKAILNQIYNIAYPNAPYNFAHPHFDELKEKLRDLFASQTI